jgi:hypothetical protein
MLGTSFFSRLFLGQQYCFACVMPCLVRNSSNQVDVGHSARSVRSRMSSRLRKLLQDIGCSLKFGKCTDYQI